MDYVTSSQGRVYIASIYYMPIRLENNPLNFDKTLDAVTREQLEDEGVASVIEIPPMIAYYELHGQMDPTNKNLPLKVPFEITSRQLAESLIRDNVLTCYGSDHMSRILPGVMVINQPRPTNDELQVMFRMQHEFAMGKVRYGDMLFNSDRAKDITPELYAAARWLKLEPGWAMRVSKPFATATISCPFCGTDVKATSVKCPKCLEIVDPEGYADLKAQTEAAINAKAKGGKQGQKEKDAA